MASILIYFRPSSKEISDEEINGTKTRADNFFWTLSKKMERSKKEQFLGDMISDIEKLKRVPKLNYFKAKFPCCNRELRNHQRLLEKS